MQRLADSHAPEFLEIDITMPQAKLLYLLGASGDLHMSELVARLGVSLSTVSGLVDRVVDHGLATRREDRADRRQVVVGLTAAGREFIDRFRELNARQMRELLAVLDDAEPGHRPRRPRGARSRRRSALPHRPTSAPARPVHPAKGSCMSRLSEFAVAKRSVTLLLAGALFIAGLLAWGSLKQELLPDIEFPVITVIAPLPGAGAADVAEQVTKPIERAISGVPRLEGLQSTSANSLSLVVAQFSFGSDVKEIRATIEQNLQNAGLPQTVSPQVTALNINASPVIIASIAATSEDGLDKAAAIAKEEIEPALLGIEGVGSVDVTGGEEQRVTHHARPGEARGERDLARPGHGRPRGQQPDLPVRPDHHRGRQDPGLHDRPHRAASRRSRALVVGVARRPPARAAVPRRAPARARARRSAGGRRRARRLGRPCTRRRLRPPRPRRARRPAAPRRSPSATSARSSSRASPRPAIARTNGKPALSLSVSKTSNANTVSVAEEVTATLDELGATYADDVTITVVSDLSTFIKESRDGLVKEGGLGALFAILTIFLFLFSIRSHDRRRGQHPALDPGRAGDHAADRHHPQHHDPGRPGGRRRARRRRRDRRPREHLPAPRPGRGPADRVASRDRRRSRARSRPPPSPRSACSCRSASSAASCPSSSCPSRSRSRSRCSPRSSSP